MNEKELEQHIEIYFGSPHNLKLNYRVIVCEVNLDSVMAYLKSKGIKDVTFEEVEIAVRSKLSQSLKNIQYGK